MNENKILLCKNVYKVPRATKMIRLVKEFMVIEKNVEKQQPKVALKTVHSTVLPAKSDSDVIFCLQLLS